MAGNTYTSIDIGSKTVKVVTLRRKGFEYEVIGASQAHLPGDLPEGEAGNVVLANIISRLIKHHKIPVGNVVMGLSGRGTLLRLLPMPVVPQWKLGMLMAFEVEEHSTPGAEIAFDYRVLGLPEFEEGSFTVLLAQAQEESINTRLDIARKSGLRANEIDISAVGVYNLYCCSSQFNEEEVSICLDIGAEETDLTLQRGSDIYFCRTITHGTSRFAARLQKDLGLSGTEAENLVWDSDGIFLNEEDLEGKGKEVQVLSNSLKVEAGSLASAIDSSINFLKTQMLKIAGRNVELNESQRAVFEPAKIYITGGGAKIKGLTEYISRRMRMGCELLDVRSAFAGFSGSAEISFNEGQEHCYATSAGLALARAKDEGFKFCLLTDAEKERRQYWGRTVYLYAAAVVALLVIVLWTIGSYRRFDVAKSTDRALRTGVKKGKLEVAELESEKKRNLNLAAMVGELERRKNYGIDLLYVMDILKNKTPTDIFFSSIKSEDPDEFIGTEKEAEEELSSRSRRGRGRRGRGGEESKDNKNKKETTGLESYGRKREISIEGYCFQKDKREASARVTKLADMLLSSGGGMFFEVRQDYGKWVEDTEELIKFFKGSGELQRIKKCSPAFHFRLVCTVVDRGAAGR